MVIFHSYVSLPEGTQFHPSFSHLNIFSYSTFRNMMTNLLKVYKVDFQLFLHGGFCMTIFMEKATSHGCNNYNDPKYQGVSDLIWCYPITSPLYPIPTAMVSPLSPLDPSHGLRKVPFSCQLPNTWPHGCGRCWSLLGGLPSKVSFFLLTEHDP
jgi:hypothetical protein